MAAPRTARVTLLGLDHAPEPTGTSPDTTALARFLADAGHDVHVVAGHRQRRGPATEERDGAVRITRVSHDVPRDPAAPGRSRREAAFAARAARVVTHAGERPDVVLAVSPALSTVAVAARHRRPGRTALGVVVGELPAAGPRSALERTLLRRADGVVAVHDRARRAIAALGVDEQRITTIRTWTHLDPRPRCGEDVRALRRELGWTDDEVVALHAGPLDTDQGLETVVEAARTADRRGSRVRFAVLGHGGRRPFLEVLGRSVARLQFLDPLPAPRVPDALAAADVLLLHERPGAAATGVPAALPSSFAAGRPVVAATNPLSAVSADIAASGAGTVVTPGTPEALLDAVLAVGTDVAEAAAMGLRGQLFAHDVLHVDIARAAYVRWVEELAAGRRRAGQARPAPVEGGGRTRAEVPVPRAESA
jgi:colanic acid biosynthesis glycosyl transferase WcaI